MFNTPDSSTRMIRVCSASDALSRQRRANISLNRNIDIRSEAYKSVRTDRLAAQQTVCISRDPLMPRHTYPGSPSRCLSECIETPQPLTSRVSHKSSMLETLLFEKSKLDHDCDIKEQQRIREEFHNNRYEKLKIEKETWKRECAHLEKYKRSADQKIVQLKQQRQTQQYHIEDYGAEYENVIYYQYQLENYLQQIGTKIRQMCYGLQVGIVPYEYDINGLLDCIEIEIRTMQKEIRDLAQECDVRYREAMTCEAELKRCCNRNKTMQEALEKSQTEKDRDKLHFESILHERQTTIANLTRDLFGIKSEMEDVKRNEENSESEFASYHLSVETHECDDKHEFQILKQKLSMLIQQKFEWEKEREKLQKEINEKDRKIDHQASENRQRERDALTDLNDIQHQCRKPKDQIDQSAKEMQEIFEAERKGMQHKIDSQQNTIEKLEGELLECKKQNDEIKNIEESYTLHRSRVEQEMVQDRMSVSKTQPHDWQDENRQLQNMAREQDALLNKMVAEHKKQIADYENELKTIQYELGHAKVVLDKERAKYQQEMEKENAKHEAMKSQIVEKEVTIQQLQTVLHKSESQRDDITKVQQECDSYRSELHERDAQLTKVLAERNEYERQLSESEQCHATHNVSVKGKEDQLRKMQEQIQQAKETTSIQQEEIAKLTRQSTLKDEETQRLSDKLIDVLKSKENLRQRVEAQDHEHGTLKSTFGASFKDLTDQLQATQENLRQANVKIKEQAQYISELNTQMAICQSSLDQEKKNLKDLTSSRTYTANLQKEIALLEQQMTELSQKNTDLVDRLAAEMNSKVSANESSLENISIAARPMKITEDYSMLVSNSWLDAKTALDGKDDSEDKEAEKVELLCSILLVSVEQAALLFDELLKELAVTLSEPLLQARHRHSDTAAPRTASRTDEAEKSLPQNIIIVVGDYLRSHANNVNLEFLNQNIITVLQTTYGGDTGMASQSMRITEVSDYIRDCARLAWKMVIQRPPMTFDTPSTGEKWSDDGRLDLMWGSNPKVPWAVIRYYKYPMLFHGDKAMMKGSVFVE